MEHTKYYLYGRRVLNHEVAQSSVHTDSDAFLHLRTERIILKCDSLVVKNHPNLTSGHPREWLNILAKIKALNPAQLIPGHGELATVNDIAAKERYINELTLEECQQYLLVGACPVAP